MSEIDFILINTSENDSIFESKRDSPSRLDSGQKQLTGGKPSVVICDSNQSSIIKQSYIIHEGLWTNPQALDNCIGADDEHAPY